jgi:hypothetical protein
MGQRSSKNMGFWSILIRLKLAGYHNTEEGKILMMRIAENMNSARYSNFSEYKKHIRKQSLGKIQTTLPSIDEISPPYRWKI